MCESALTLFGYTPREAAWLEHVIRHAGAFLRRQYLAYIGHAARGAVDQRFLTRLRASGHAQVWPYHRKERVYHLTAKPLYEAVGHPDLRHRRPIPPHRLAQKLMLLDFMLQERHHRWLATEDEKVQFFLYECGVEIGVLPCRVYRSAVDPRSQTTRYFLDRFSIPIASDGRAGFVYPDFSGDPHAFRTFLDDHRALIEALPKGGDIVYLTGRLGTSHRAQMQVRRRFGPAAEDDRLTRIVQLAEYFATCRALREHDYGKLLRDWLARHEEQERVFARPAYEGFAPAWSDGGITGLTKAVMERGLPPPQVTFRHVSLPYVYYFLGRP